MKTSYAVLGLVAAAAIAVPAFAAANYIGSIPMAKGGIHETTFAGFTGPVSSLQLIAEGNDVRCRAVTVTFADGHEAKIFSGDLADKSVKEVAFSGSDQKVSQLSFECKTTDSRPGSIGVAVVNG